MVIAIAWRIYLNVKMMQMIIFVRKKGYYILSYKCRL